MLQHNSGPSNTLATTMTPYWLHTYLGFSIPLQCIRCCKSRDVCDLVHLVLWTAFRTMLLLVELHCCCLLWFPMRAYTSFVTNERGFGFASFASHRKWICSSISTAIPTIRIRKPIYAIYCVLISSFSLCTDGRQFIKCREREIFSIWFCKMHHTDFRRSSSCFYFTIFHFYFFFVSFNFFFYSRFLSASA